MRERQVVIVVGGAVVIGAMVDGLLRAEPWGVGFAVVISIAVLLAIVVARGAGRVIEWQTYALALGGVSCGAMVVTRDSPTLVAFDLIFCTALLLMIPASVLGLRHNVLGPGEWLATSVVAGFDAAVGALVFLGRDLPWPRIRQARIGKPALAFTRGAVLAAPPLIVFGLLLSSADAVFAGLLRELIDIDLDELVLHAIFFGIGTWVAMGWLARAGGEQPPFRVALDLPDTAKVGFTEVAIVLGTIDVLFLGFVAVQLRYFFGGADLIEAVPGLTRAEYARSGFFQLVAVAALVVLLLLFVDWVVERRPRSLAWSRALAIVQIALVMVMLVSAWMRMRLYVEEFGLTELRFYTSVFMIWLGVILVLFSVTALVGRRDRFATVAVVLGVATLLALNVANPDAIIVRTNVERAESGRTFDPEYFSRLSADAVPAILEALDSVSTERRAQLASGLESRAVEAGDWRTWNVSRSRAKRLLSR